MNKEEKENIISKVKFILQGIDQTETDSKEGWWETSTGANFGEEKLAKIIQAIEEELIIKPSKPEEVKSLPSAEEYFASIYKNGNALMSSIYLSEAIETSESFASLCVEQERKRIKQLLLEMMESADSQAQVFEKKGMEYGALSYQAMSTAYQRAESKI